MFKSLKFHLINNVSINDKHKHEHNKCQILTFINKHKIVCNSWQLQKMTLNKMQGKNHNVAVH